MRPVFFVKALLLFLTMAVPELVAQGEAVKVLRALHQRYEKAPCRSYTFSQKNTHYKNDTVSGHSVWQEAIELPDKFRIDFGERGDSNYVVFRSDSVFRHRKGRPLSVRREPNTLLLLLGGMFYRDLEDVLQRLKQDGFDLSKYSVQTWNGEPVDVIGALEGDLNSSQFWISKRTSRVLRIIENHNGPLDVRFETHQPWCKGYVETKVSFWRNGHLEQVEEYYDLKESAGFPE